MNWCTASPEFDCDKLNALSNRPRTPHLSKEEDRYGCDEKVDEMRELLEAHRLRIEKLEALLIGRSETPSRTKSNDRHSTTTSMMEIAHGNVNGKEEWRPPGPEKTPGIAVDKLQNIFNKPYRKRRKKVALYVGSLMLILAMPFGPIGMAAAGVIGVVLGGIVGHCVDQRKQQGRLQEMTIAKRRLENLIRWAGSRSHDDEEVRILIKVVIPEFKPIADIAEGSHNARKLLRLLDTWVSQKPVTRQIWIYTDDFLKKFRNLKHEDCLDYLRVFQTLVAMYRHSSRKLGFHEQQYLYRMERLLTHSAVHSAMQHATRKQDEARVMEVMVYADAEKLRRRSKGSNGTPSSKRHSTAEIAEGDVPAPDVEKAVLLSEESDDDLGALGTNSSAGLAMEVENAKQPASFFKNYTDFMDFDVDIKHKMTITEGEFDLLIEKSLEAEDEPWESCVNRKEIRVCKMSPPGGIPPVITLRAWGTVPDVDLAVAFHLFYDIKQRVQWDKVFETMEVVTEGIDDGCEVVYSLMRVPLATARDFCQYRRVALEDDGSICIVLRSAEHPAFPKVKDVIRAESYISGYILRQSYENNKPVLNIFLMAATDIKGLVPKWIINAVAPRKPQEWIDTLRKAALTYQAAHPNYKDELAPLMTSIRRRKRKMQLTSPLSQTE